MGRDCVGCQISQCDIDKTEREAAGRAHHTVMNEVCCVFLSFFKKQRFSSSKNRFIKHPENETNIIETYKVAYSRSSCYIEGEKNK